MANKYDVVVGCKYTTSSGEEKTAWTRIGTAFEKDGRISSAKLDALPLPNEKGEVWLSFFEPREKDGGSKQSPQFSRKPAGPIDGDIPF
jgi:hypothetical protein